MNRARPRGTLPRHVGHSSRGSVILFDLDGTLVDPAGGITGGIAHALQAAGHAPPDESTLRSMIGPKLTDALLTHTSATLEQIPDIVASYRRWYAETGMAMGKVYPGIIDLLDTLVDAGMMLGVATQKPQAVARAILRKHGIDVYFDVIAGAPDEEAIVPGQQGFTPGKAEIIAYAIAALPPATAVMIGDRAQDVEGALANSIACIGAGWGYADAGELEKAGAATVLAEVKDLTPHLLLQICRDGASPPPRVPGVP